MGLKENDGVIVEEIEEIKEDIDSYKTYVKILFLGLIITVIIGIRMFIVTYNYKPIDSTISKVSKGFLFNNKIEAYYIFDNHIYSFRSHVFPNFDKKVGDTYKINIDYNNPTKIKYDYMYKILIIIVIILTLFIAILMYINGSKSIIDSIKLRKLENKKNRVKTIFDRE